MSDKLPDCLICDNTGWKQGRSLWNAQVCNCGNKSNSLFANNTNDNYEYKEKFKSEVKEPTFMEMLKAL